MLTDINVRLRESVSVDKYKRTEDYRASKRRGIILSIVSTDKYLR